MAVSIPFSRSSSPAAAGAMRAVLTGIREKRHLVEQTKRNGITCYRIAVAG